ncbi:MAG: uracil-DNA glycosylase, partial [Hyphomicrobiales bacterium]|nr:uracil-DNA glycosylase [Hyphomicrobiales bacterium]
MDLATATEPDRDCDFCERLVAFRHTHRELNPTFHNAPVPTWYPEARNGGKQAVKLMVVGMAPGLRGANRTGRPFTGDWAGDLLYSTLCEFGFAEGRYEADPEDSLKLRD